VTAAELFAGLRILVVEDEYLIAMELSDRLAAAGAQVIGPVGTIREALSLIAEQGAKLDGATLDINVRGTLVFPVADELRGLGVPFVFCTGYDQQKIPERHLRVRRCEKPVDAGCLVDELSHAIADAGAADRRLG
jgi:CheY-like chemotaxis protein